MKVLISADGQTVRMRKKAWAMSCPATDLPRWIKTYTDLRDRRAGAFAADYREDLTDLIKAQERLKQRGAA